MSTWISWSAGKDSAYALGRVADAGGLVTTVVGDHVAMSRVPVAVLRRQAEGLRLPLVTVEVIGTEERDGFVFAMIA